jgi:hypothetical protein
MNPQIESMNYTRNGSSATRARIQLGDKTLRFSVHIPPSARGRDARSTGGTSRGEDAREASVDPIFSKAEARRKFTDLDDAAEVGAEERRGGAGGPAPLGRGRRQHLRRRPLPLATPIPLLCSARRSAAGLPLLLRWIAGAPAPCPVVRSDDAWLHSRSRAREIWLALPRCALVSRLPLLRLLPAGCYCYECYQREGGGCVAHFNELLRKWF